MRARSEARNTAGFAVSEITAGTFKKLRLAILEIIWSFVTFILLARASIVCWMVRLSVLAVRHPPQSGWLSEWGRLKGGCPGGSVVALKRAFVL